jgi:hypothetical protein
MALCLSRCTALQAIAHLIQLPSHVRRTLDVAICEELTQPDLLFLNQVLHTKRAQTLLHIVSNEHGSMWLGAVLKDPSLRFYDQSFQEAGCMEMRDFSSFGHGATGA